MKFPEHFLWGGAVAANQCEGAYLAGGKQLNVTDVMVGIGGKPDLKWNDETQKWEPALDPAKVYLSHYETPLHLLTEYGGWLNEKMIDFWLRYVKVVLSRYKGKVRYYLSFNEINIILRMPFAGGGILDIHPADTSRPNAGLTKASLIGADVHDFLKTGQIQYIMAVFRRLATLNAEYALAAGRGEVNAAEVFEPEAQVEEQDIVAKSPQM